MLYKHNQTEKLEDSLFQNPTSEYRGAPFWAWNCVLKEEQLKRQIGYLKEMGFGGFNMHCRTGMATQYLSQEFFQLIRDCVQEGERQDMLAWTYDEDRWPSGAAGGMRMGPRAGAGSGAGAGADTDAEPAVGAESWAV